MHPNYLKILGLNIATYQNRDHGFPIIFIHGNSLSASTFTNQFNDPLLNKYRLVAFDIPGQGNTGKSNNPEQDYSPITFIKILIELCSQLNIGNGVLVGHSLGGHIALDSLPYLTEIKGIVTFGTTPLTVPPRLDLAFLPNPILGLIFKPELSEDEIEQVAAGFVANGSASPKEIIESLKRTDPLVRLYVGKALSSGATMDEVSILTNRRIPYALLHGKMDQLVNSNYFELLPKEIIWGNRVHYIKGVGHSPQLEKPKEFNKILVDFISSLNI